FLECHVPFVESILRNALPPAFTAGLHASPNGSRRLCAFKWYGRPPIVILRLVSQFVRRYAVFKKRRHDHKVLAFDKADIRGVRTIFPSIQYDVCFRATDEKYFAVPAASYVGAVVKDYQAIAAGHLGVKDFCRVISVFAESFQALAVKRV